jgi:predicted DCC family thiol-disulfide oxidoreductase YuxK
VSAASRPIVLYDGVCGLCNRLVQFTLRHDHARVFRFASLQSAFAGAILQRHNRSVADLDTFYVVVEPQESTEYLLSRSDAMAYVLEQLGGRWRVLGTLWRSLPRFIRDPIYNLVAKYRYKIFGKLNVCPIPTATERERFVDL